VSWLDPKYLGAIIFDRLHNCIITVIDSLVFDELSQKGRVVFVTNTHPKKFMYLVVLNRNMNHIFPKDSEGKMYSPHLAPLKPTPEVEPEPASNPCSPPVKKQKTLPLIIEFGTVEAVKVLFKSVEGENDETEYWYNDNFVQMVECSTQMYEYLKRTFELQLNIYGRNVMNPNDLNPGYLLREDDFNDLLQR